jgi:hypothetical protein
MLTFYPLNIKVWYNIDISLNIRNKMKKVIVSILAALGLLVATPVLAATTAPVPSPTGTTMMINGSAAISGQSGMMTQQNGTRVIMSCPMMDQNYGAQDYGTTNMMYKQNPCSGMYTNYMAHNGYGRNMVGWLGLMFVMTVLLVWVVLLLLIGVLWHMLKKHRKG